MVSLANSEKRGIMPKPLLIHDNSSSFARVRFLLKDAWNTSSSNGSSYNKLMTSPFRAVENAGDVLSRQNYSCGGPNQAVQSKPGLHGLSMKIGSNSGNCKPSVVYSDLQLNKAIPASTCNVKYVYDSSNYIRFKKQQAMNRNYNDRNFGGDAHNASQSALRAIKRY